MTNTYYGIADSIGLESLLLDVGERFSSFLLDDDCEFGTKVVKQTQFSMSMRALANKDRMAVVYRAEIDDDDADAIKKLIDTNQEKAALLLLKANAIKVELGTYGTTKALAAEKWHMIPFK